ncbi:putative pol-like 36 [Homarus americanus]|uniref:Putative pol-like 36 n=1 Tax=Homarus americanus TaxID=6706 RepID=A0A8J5MZH5_HOMAM|nr:putative pol-like 36 [Homarus americanus]
MLENCPDLQPTPSHYRKQIAWQSTLQNAHCLFTIDEIRRARKTSKDTAPGSDGITYSLLSNAGLAGELALITVINASWSAGKLPSAWKGANIVPIPKPNDPPNFRPISLTACIGKTAERMVHFTTISLDSPKGDIKNGLLRALNLNRDVFNKKTWLLCAADAVNRLKLKDTILSKGPDTMSPDYSTPAPWESPPAIFNIYKLG